MLRMSAAIAALMASLAGAAWAEDRVLNVYNWSDYIAEDTIAKFEAATGIKVRYDVYDSNETLEAKLLAGSTGYDIVVPTSGFLRRQIAAGVYMPLDRSKLPNLANMDPKLMENASAYDEGNAHSVIYLWGTTGIGYNVDKVRERLGDAAPWGSARLIFDPANAEKLADCGIALLDAPDEILPAAMNFAGVDPRSTAPEDFEKGAEVLMKIRPFVRYFHSSQYINDLANGDICIVYGWSGDVFQAKARAEEAGNGVNIAYVIPEEGALQWFDMMAIPNDAPSPDLAHQFINFIMDPQITADITNYVHYANANAAALPMVAEEIKTDPGIYPTDEVKAKLWGSAVYDAKSDRALNRTWTRIKTGE
jgi:putrescine transport system substrate-binding protein